MRSPPLTTFGTVFAVGGVFACVQGVSSHDPKLSLFGLLFVAVGTLLLLAGIADVRGSPWAPAATLNTALIEWTGPTRFVRLQRCPQVR